MPTGKPPDLGNLSLGLSAWMLLACVKLMIQTNHAENTAVCGAPAEHIKRIPDHLESQLRLNEANLRLDERCR